MHSRQPNDPKSFSRRSERGQDLAEYALLISFIAIVTIAGVTIFGQNLASLFSAFAERFLAIF